MTRTKARGDLYLVLSLLLVVGRGALVEEVPVVEVEANFSLLALLLLRSSC